MDWVTFKHKPLTYFTDSVGRYGGNSIVKVVIRLLMAFGKDVLPMLRTAGS